MKTKTLSLLSLSVLSTLILISCVSATVDFGNVVGNSQTVNQGATVTFTFDVQATTFSGQFDDASLVLPDLFGVSTTWSGDTGNFTLLPDTNVSKTISVIVPSTQAAGVYSGNVSFTGTYNLTGSPVVNDLPISITVSVPTPATIPTEIEDCQALGNLGDNIDLQIDDIKVKEGYGKDEDWLPLDTIEVRIDIDNRGDDRLDNIEIEWGLYDSDNDNWIIDDKESKFDLKKDKDDTITFTFKLDDPSELEDQGDYIFYVWANAEDDEFNGNDSCAFESERISIEYESDFVVVDDVSFSDVTSCGSDLRITADVWNIGEDDQDEVSVLIKNNELGIDKIVEIGDINAFDSEKLEVTLKIPGDAEEKTYELSFIAIDEDNDIYENDYDEDESITQALLKVEGSCGADFDQPKAIVSANLESGGKAGEELTVKVTITNTGDKTNTYTINAARYTGWASSVDLDQSTLILNAGESKDVLVTFTTNADASGDYTFDIEVISDGKMVIKQPVSVTLEGRTGFSGFSGSAINQDNWYLWGIGILNIVLVVIIIVVAMRVAKR